MAVRDLRTLFSSNDRSISADEAFTNRQAQWQAVTAGLTEHIRHVTRADFDVEDLEAPRRNVLVFHGVGGIGKSMLSRKIEASLARGEHRPAQWESPSHREEQTLPVRIDLARAAGVDFERVILTIRLAVTALGRPMPAFDLALRRYWEHNHPGEPIEDYLRRGGLLSRSSAAAALPQQMQSALSDVAQALLLPGTVGSALGHGAGALIKALRERRQSVRALAGCSRLADLLEAEPDLEALSFYPHLLSWDLAQLPADKSALPVILLDTFEDTGDRTHRDLERLLQRIVWLMPNAFFVVTGRNRLQWAETSLAGQLDWTGPNAWPSLVPDTAHARSGVSGRQILIGDFSPEDCDDYLARRLSRDGQPLIAEPVRRIITERSHGLPLFLDLSVMRYLELRRGGRQPQVTDFDHDFPALIARTLSDLTAEERHVLRSVSLLSAFSVPLASQVAGMDHDAPALRLTERPFIRDSPSGVWPFHVHDLIRAAIRNAEDGADDRWSEQDWQRAAQRAFRALESQWRQDQRRDRTVLVGCLQQGLFLARDFHLDLGWLADAAFQYAGDSIWEPLALPAADDTSSSALQTAADALVETLSAIARRQHEHRERTANRLSAVLASELLPDGLVELATYYLAKAQRDLGLTDDSRRSMQRVVSTGGRLASAALRGLAHLSRLSGDFPAAVEAAGRLGWEGRHHRVLGDVWWVQGDTERATAAYLAARSEAEEHGVVGETAMVQAHLAFAVSFADPLRADDELDLADRLLSHLSLRSSEMTARIATLVRDAGFAGDVPDRAAVLLAEISGSGISYAAAKLQLALCFHHAVLDAQDDLTTAIARLRELTQSGDYAYYVEIAYYLADLPLPEDTARARWIDGEQRTRERWRDIVMTRRDHLSTAR
ncbi:ATP/GTP-binding protein [Streptomyces sp. AK02-01A]|uniref:ATP/GTP-binding protein n=1 Tax=Streptomyces sp. AK02-01A TaxID=3028648 RepID=UPI0029BABF40|nr:ATP/GTP-binding protein [Streptomyces sp. AK02-01A]MDX3851067.1 ATP/GTP-binding protein [Streptomyces sp. AK02-01A]